MLHAYETSLHLHRNKCKPDSAKNVLLHASLKELLSITLDCGNNGDLHYAQSQYCQSSVLHWMSEYGCSGVLVLAEELCINCGRHAPLLWLVVLLWH